MFLDRDGVLNAETGDYVTRPEQLQLLPGAAEAVARLHRAGLPVVVVTNQAGIGRGRYSETDLMAIHDRLRAELAAAGGAVDAIYHCPHHPDDGCDCRKPRPGLLLRAAAELGLELDRAVLVGDKLSDHDAARAVGAGFVLVGTGYGRQTAAALQACGGAADGTVEDLAAAADWILGPCGS